MHTSTGHHHDPELRASSEQRVARIRTLARALFDLTILNTATSRARCREMAGEMIQLLAAEDECEQPSHPMAADGDLQAMQRPSEALRARHAGEQAELSRLAIVSRRTDPTPDSDLPA